MKVRFLNLSVKDAKQKRELLKGVERVLNHGRIVLGPEVQELEEKIASYCGVGYAVGVNSGTDALYFALRALGIGKGDEVITTCLSFVATANAIALTGAKPVFVDIREDFNIDPQKIIPAIGRYTKAIVPVHFTGKLCDMRAIEAIAKKYKLLIVEDAAQAFGASCKNRKAGSFGMAAALSMNPMKVFAACGEAGMVVTNDQAIAKDIRALRYNGTFDSVNASFVSLNGRLDTLQAAILLARLKHFKKFVEHRRFAADYYSENLYDIVDVPLQEKDSCDVFYTYNIKCSRRGELKDFLEEKGVETKIHHPVLMPHNKAYKKTSGGKWPVGERIVKQSLCLPIHENITKKELDYVITCVRQFYR